VLLGDHHLRTLSHPQLTTIEIVDDMEARYGVPRDSWNDFVCHNSKPLIQFYRDLRTYDYALYMDLDVLVNTNRLEALLESKARRGRIAVQRDIVPIAADRFFTGGRILTPEEKRRWADHAICAGIVGVPINEVGLRLLRDWHEMNRAGALRSSDQANLIALLLRHYDGVWEYMGDTVIARKATAYDETLLHFSNHMHELLRDYDDAVLRLPESRTFERRLRRARRRWLVHPINRLAQKYGPALWRYSLARTIGERLWRSAAVRQVGRRLWEGESEV
jgi:hypothetical protein